MGRTISQLSPSEIRFIGGSPFRTAEQRKQVYGLIRRLVGVPGMAVGKMNPVIVTLEPLSGGRSAAQVFRLSIDFGPDCRATSPPVIVKIAPRGEGLREKTCYDAYVRRGLPADCRPELLGFAQVGRYDGLCFSSVGRDDGSEIETLTDCLRRGESKKLALIFRRIFDPMRESWFSPPELRSEEDIARHYHERYFKGARWTSKTESALQACATRYFGAVHQDRRTIIAEHSFPSPRTVLFGSGMQSPYLSCILHGDLNSDNIVIAGPSRVAVVDFLKTGRGHVYRDLVSLEASVRINDPHHASFDDILEIERRISMGRRPQTGHPYWSSIRKIRNAAFGYFGGIEHVDKYHFAVAAIGLRLMRAADLSDLAKARITASTLWAAKALAGESLA